MGRYTDPNSYRYQEQTPWKYFMIMNFVNYVWSGFWLSGRCSLLPIYSGRYLKTVNYLNSQVFWTVKLFQQSSYLNSQVNLTVQESWTYESYCTNKIPQLYETLEPTSNLVRMKPLMIQIIWSFESLEASRGIFLILPECGKCLYNEFLRIEISCA